MKLLSAVFMIFVSIAANASLLQGSQHAGQVEFSILPSPHIKPETCVVVLWNPGPRIGANMAAIGLTVTGANRTQAFKGDFLSTVDHSRPGSYKVTGKGFIGQIPLQMKIQGANYELTARLELSDMTGKPVFVCNDISRSNFEKLSPGTW